MLAGLDILILMQTMRLELIIQCVHTKYTSYIQCRVICLVFCLFHSCCLRVIRLVGTMKDFLSCFYAPTQTNYRIKRIQTQMIILDNDRWAAGLAVWNDSPANIDTPFEDFNHYRSIAFKWLFWSMNSPVSSGGGVVLKWFRFITKETVSAVMLQVHLHHSDGNEEFVSLCVYICVSRYLASDQTAFKLFGYYYWIILAI